MQKKDRARLEQYELNKELKLSKKEYKDFKRSYKKHRLKKDEYKLHRQLMQETIKSSRDDN
jgi:hypothetical protein